jgi:hypothetical protein
VNDDEKRHRALKATQCLIILASAERERLAQVGRKPEADWWAVAIAQLEAWLPALRQPGATKFIIPRAMVEDYEKVMRGLSIRSDPERIRQTLPEAMQTFGYCDDEIKPAVKPGNETRAGKTTRR